MSQEVMLKLLFCQKGLTLFSLFPPDHLLRPLRGNVIAKVGVL